MSEFKFNCPHCDQHLEAPPEMMGNTIDCPACAKPLYIPSIVNSARILPEKKSPPTIPQGQKIQNAEIKIRLRFFPLAYFLFFCTPTIEIDGVIHRRYWGTHVFPVAPGKRRIRIYIRYFFMSHCGDNAMDVFVHNGYTAVISFFMPLWVLGKGTIQEIIPDGGVQKISHQNTSLGVPTNSKDLQELFFANIGQRILAILIDAILVLPPCGIIVGLIILPLSPYLASMNRFERNEILESIVQCTLLILIWLYFALLESSSKQATIGKMVMRIKVTNLSGKRISFGRATGRFFGKFISMYILFIGFLMPLWTSRKQALHDMIAKCLVIKKD
jgi:uncharacterized RDD family membrane protein YckC